MPKIHIEFDAKAVQRFADFTFNPGDPMEIQAEGREVITDWVGADGRDDPGVTVSQAEIIRDFVEDGLTLVMDEDGKVSLLPS